MSRLGHGLADAVVASRIEGLCGRAPFCLDHRRGLCQTGFEVVEPDTARLAVLSARSTRTVSARNCVRRATISAPNSVSADPSSVVIVPVPPPAF